MPFTNENELSVDNEESPVVSKEGNMTIRDDTLRLYRKSARGGSTIPPDLNYRTGWEYQGLTPKKDAKPVAQAIVNRMEKPSILVDLYHRQDCRPCKKRERVF